MSELYNVTKLVLLDITNRFSTSVIVQKLIQYLMQQHNT